MALRDQFQEFAIHGVNYSLCFSARSDYFSNIRSFAKPAVRFYEKVYLSSFTPEETCEYTATVFGDSARTQHLSRWLYEKALGHPYFLAFVSRQLLALARGSISEPELFWPTIFRRLEREKFLSDLAQVTEKEVQLLREIAKSGNEQISQGTVCIRHSGRGATQIPHFKLGKYLRFSEQAVLKWLESLENKGF